MSASLGSDDESTIKVAPTKKDGKEKALKLKKSAPKQNKPGNWRDASVIDGSYSAIESRPLSSRAQSLTYCQSLDEKKKGADTPSTNSVPASPGPIVNQLDDSAKETFATGRPLEDTPKIQQCKHCKKSILNTAITAHVIACLKVKKEKAQRKKEQKEAREREKKGMDADSKKDDDGDTRMEDDDDAEEDASPEKKGPGGLKSTKKSAGKKLEIDDTKKGKKRKADGDAEKGPKQKKKKEEPKPKAPKPKGIYFSHLLTFTPPKFPTSPFDVASGWLSARDMAVRSCASAPVAAKAWSCEADSLSPTKRLSRNFGERSAFIGPRRPRGRPRLYQPKTLAPKTKRNKCISPPARSGQCSKFISPKRPRGRPRLLSPGTLFGPSNWWTRSSAFKTPGHEDQNTPPLVELGDESTCPPPSKKLLTRPNLHSPSTPMLKMRRTRSGKLFDVRGPPTSKEPKEPKKPKEHHAFITYNPELPANSLFQGPVDVERQCGVIIKDGVQCARSLTCKSHSMGAKRAVPGRSLPYDMLLAAYQKKNQAKQQSTHPLHLSHWPVLTINRSSNRCKRSPRGRRRSERPIRLR